MAYVVILKNDIRLYDVIKYCNINHIDMTILKKRTILLIVNESLMDKIKNEVKWIESYSYLVE